MLGELIRNVGRDSEREAGLAHPTWAGQREQGDSLVEQEARARAGQLRLPAN